MATDLYKGFTNDIAGETFRCIAFTPEAFHFEWTVKPGGYIPFEHIHINQEEVFHVKSGELRILIDGKQSIVKADESITVPKGMAHIAYNNTTSPLYCEVKYQPGLDNFLFFQCFGGLTIDKDISKNGTINIPKMLYFSRKMKAKCVTRPTSIPAPVFLLASNFFYALGSLLGWKRYYTKYTGEN